MSIRFEDIIKDKDFQSLPVQEQAKAFSEMLPGFKDLSVDEQLKGVADIMSMGSSKPSLKIEKPGFMQIPIDPTSASLGMFDPKPLMPSMETISNQVPVAGAMITAPFKNVPALAPIAGLGMAGGGLINRAMTGTEETPTTQEQGMMEAGLPFATGGMLKDFLIGAGAEYGAQKLAQGIGKIASPFKTKFTEYLSKIKESQYGQEMVEQGMAISPKEIFPNRLTKWASAIADNIFPGSLMTNYHRKSVTEGLMKLRQDFIEKTMEMPSFKASIPEARVASRDAYAAFKETTGKAEIPMYETSKYIENYINDPLIKNDSIWNKKFIPWWKKGMDRTVDDVNELNVWYNKGWHKLNPKQQQIRSGLQEAIYKDLKFYDDAMGLMTEDALKTAQAKAKNVHDIARSRWIERALLKPATVTGQNMETHFFPQIFKEQVENNLSKIEAMFPGRREIFEKFADKLMIAVPDAAKRLKGASHRQLLEVGPFISTAAIAYQPWMVLPLGLQGVMAQSLMNPTGYFRRWLTSGLKPPRLIGKEIPKLGMLEATND